MGRIIKILLTNTSNTVKYSLSGSSPAGIISGNFQKSEKILRNL